MYDENYKTCELVALYMQAKILLTFWLIYLAYTLKLLCRVQKLLWRAKGAPSVVYVSLKLSTC